MWLFRPAESLSYDFQIISHFADVRPSQCRIIGWRRPSIGSYQYRSQHGDDGRGGAKEVAPNGQGPRLFADVAGQPKPTSCTEGISHSKQTTTAVGFISDTEEIVKTSWSHFQHDGVAECKLLEKSPVPPGLSANVLPGGRTQVLNVRRIKRIDCHPAESDDDCSPESISDTKNWLNWNGDLENPNDSEDDWEADNELDMELDNGSEDSETPEWRNVSAAPNVPGLIQPI